MNDQLQAQITEILAQIMVAVAEVKDFSVQQLPDVAQQYINYGMWSTVFYITFNFLTIIVCVGMGLSIIRFSIKKNDGDIAMFCMFPAAAIIVSIIALLTNIHTLIMINTAPKVWFLLELKKLLS
jgi:hypothetical protein